MSAKGKKLREIVIYGPGGTPHNIMVNEDDLLEEAPQPLPPDALEKLLAGKLRPGMKRRLHDELLREAIKQDRPDALRCLLPKSRKLPPEEFDALFQTVGHADSPDVRAWLLQYRRERYTAAEWDAWEQRKLDLELGFAEPTLAEFKRLYKVSFSGGGICIGGIKKIEPEMSIPASVEGKPVVSVDTAALYPLASPPRFSRRFAGEICDPEALNAAQPGTVLRFGRRAERKSTAERPILWRAAQRQGDRLLLICEESVAQLPYHAELEEVSWERCRLRLWLNEVFLPLSFTAGERARICRTAVSAAGNALYGTPGGADTQDDLFLPSAEELRRWLPNDEQRALGFWYWTRTAGFDESFAIAVTPDGALSKTGTFVDAEDYGVRPAMWIRFCNRITMTEAPVNPGASVSIILNICLSLCGKGDSHIAVAEELLELLL